MKSSAWSSLAISASSTVALAVAPAATAHVTVTPPFVAAGESTDLSFTGPNERRAPMIGFRLKVPGDFRIVSATASGNWQPNASEATVTWRGGSLAPGSESTFTVELNSPAGPGPAKLEAEQLYPGGSVVRWPVPLTVTPGPETPGQNLGLALVTAVLGLLALTVVAIFMWRQRPASLQER